MLIVTTTAACYLTCRPGGGSLVSHDPGKYAVVRRSVDTLKPPLRNRVVATEAGRSTRFPRQEFSAVERSDRYARSLGTWQPLDRRRRRIRTQ